MQSLDKYMYRYLFGAGLVVIIAGTVFYHLVEKLSWLNSYYFSVITLTTVGYGDITPHTAAGKIFTTFYVFFGIGIVTTFISLRVRNRAEKFATRRQKNEETES